LPITVSGLCEGGALKAQMLNSSQMPNISTNVELSTEAPLLQNPCCRQFLFIRQPKVDCKTKH